MKKFLTKYNFAAIFIILAIIFVPSKINTIALENKPSQNSKYNSYEYVIDNYDININVNENNTFDITENITAYFNIPKHGIFRTIPLKNTVTRLDGTTSKNRAKISNLTVDNEYETSRENGNYKIKIGSANQTFIGQQSYLIKYTYNIGKDPIKDYDELYYNIIGTEWDTVIGNVTFNITMPKEFDYNKLGFSSSSFGSTNNDNVKYTVNGNQISGSYDGILEIGEALTIRLELPEGYFVVPETTMNFIDYIMLAIPILFLLISIFLWYKFGRDEQIVETVEFYPPEGFNSLEIGYLYKGKAENQDVISLLIYLANEGYIKISEIEQKSLFAKSNGFKITKLKDYDGNNTNERLFLEGLFTKHASINSVANKIMSTPFEIPTLNKILDSSNNNANEVTSNDLYNNFYTTMEKILANTNNKENKNKIFEKSASIMIVFVYLMIIASYCLMTIPPLIAYGDDTFLIPILLMTVLGFTFIIFNNNADFIIYGIGLLGVIFFSAILPAILQSQIYLTGYIIGLICVLGMIICAKYLPKRTSYGNKMLGKLRGFKNFLETTEKDKLEAMVMEDPNYFYNILPYTYVLGVSDKWIKKFETIALQAPSWYDSPTKFNTVRFGTFMNNTMASAQNVMTSKPQSNSSSSKSSGGGISGGGSGGGGGGSW